MRVAVISDIHGNLHALEAVLAAIDDERPDAIWCLGDLVGYGPRPNECTETVAQRANVCLVGNHDLGVTGAISLEEFSHDAALAARWTQTVLEDRWRTFLEGLEPTAQVEGADLYHASPRDPVWDYVLTADGAYDALNRTEAPLVLVGHSHVAIQVVLAGGRLDGGLAPAGTEVDLGAGRYLINPGSVGQPRDGDPRAAFVILDLDRMFATFRRVEYPVEQTQAELRERGLPETLAERLAHGQ
jgi:predicted phosphodiesterase